MNQNHMDRIQLEELRVECIIGMHEVERYKPQPLILDIGLSADLTQAAWSGSIEHTVNYAYLADIVKFICTQGKFRLIETAGMAICHCVLEPGIIATIPVSACRIRVRKPQALSGKSIPSITIERQQHQIRPTRAGWGEFTIFSSREAEFLAVESAHGPSGAHEFQLADRKLLRMVRPGPATNV